MMWVWVCVFSHKLRKFGVKLQEMNFIKNDGSTCSKSEVKFIGAAVFELRLQLSYQNRKFSCFGG